MNATASTGGRPFGAGVPASQQRSWWSVHVFVAALVSQAENLPAAGTPSWCALPDSDPRKLLALAVDGEHHVLRVEMAQEALADASRSVAASADWRDVGRGRGSAYIPREVA